MTSGSDVTEDQYVDNAWQEGETPDEAQSGVSRNISTSSYPSAYRLGQSSPYESGIYSVNNYTPYRGGGANVQHGVTQLFNPVPPDAGLEPPPSSEGPVIGGEPAAPAMQFPQPTPVSIVSTPQPNQIPNNRDGQIRLPPRNGIYGMPIVMPLVSREQHRTGMYFATDNHFDGQNTDAAMPYCSHITFQRDLGNFIFENPVTGRPSATWGLPLQSDGTWLGSFPHTEPVYGFNTTSFDPVMFEFYLTKAHIVNKALWLIDDMSAAEYHMLMKDPGEASARVASAVSRMDFLAITEQQSHRIMFFNMQYSSQVG